MSRTSKEVDATQAKIYCHCFRLTHWIQSWQLSSNENVYITEAASTIIVREMASFFFLAGCQVKSQSSPNQCVLIRELFGIEDLKSSLQF